MHVTFSVLIGEEEAVLSLNRSRKDRMGVSNGSIAMCGPSLHLRKSEITDRTQSLRLSCFSLILFAIFSSYPFFPSNTHVSQAETRKSKKPFLFSLVFSLITQFRQLETFMMDRVTSANRHLFLTLYDFSETGQHMHKQATCVCESERVYLFFHNRYT